MPPKLYLSLVFHNHQPVGNFENVFSEAFEKAYLPLVELYERHPTVKGAMHFTGPLRDWILRQRHWFFPRVRALVERGQLEVLGGGYYEPILVMLSDADKIGQMRMLSQAVEDDFGVMPRGAWLSERVWEPSLPKPIHEAGLQYAIVDDTHFNFTGIDDADLFGYYVTEEQGYPLNLFASSKDLRYLLPWRVVDEVIAWLRGRAEVLQNPLQPPPLALMGDDGEKFGMWQGTYQLCWTEGYMDRLFAALEANADWLETTTPGEYMRKFPARGRAYLPTASYLEMTEWALPAPRFHDITALRRDIEREIDIKQWSDPGRAQYLRRLLRYMRGGSWRGFLAKYPEVNHMQKRAQYTSRRVHALPDGGVKRDALKSLWAAQCNCAYWHGVFGGIYLFHIRAANYANILEAESLALADTLTAERFDFDQDSRDEIVISGSPFTFVIAPALGGALFEWDDLASRYNLLNIMTRHEEGYHIKLREAAARNEVITPSMPQWHQPENVHTTHVRAKQLGLEHALIVDWHRRGAFIDHFLGDNVTLHQFANADYNEAGDFVLGNYIAVLDVQTATACTVTLTRDGHVWVGDVHQPVRVKKVLTIEKGERAFKIEYTVTNLSTSSLKLRFGIETAYGFDGGDTPECYLALPNGDFTGLGMQGELPNVSHYRVATKIRGFEVGVESTQSGDLWRFPLEPVTMSEAGYERIHQGTVLLHVFTIELAAGRAWTNTFRLKIEDL